MKFLIPLALACLVSAAEEPLPFSGKFNTIYLAGKSVSTTAENSQVRMLMREVKYFNQYRVMSLTFYVRKNGMCKLHTVSADKFQRKYCLISRDSYLKECPKRNGTDSIPGIWTLRDPALVFTEIYFHGPVNGGRHRKSGEFQIVIHFASNTTILFKAIFRNHLNYKQSLTGALATGTNLTEEMWEEYRKLTKQSKIPIKNIENVYETDACPKEEP